MTDMLHNHILESPFAPDDDFAIQTFPSQLLAKATSLFLSSEYLVLNFFLDSDLDLTCFGKMINETGNH